MAAGETNWEENETMRRLKRRKMEKEGTVAGCELGTSLVEEECHHQFPKSECDSLESASSSSVSCCSRSQEKSKQWKMEDEGVGEYDNFMIKRRDPEEEELINVDSEAMEVESRRRRKKRRRSCETVEEAELEGFFQAAEKDVRNEMLECSIKYNFDFEKGEPLGGRYEWLKFIP